MKKSENVFKKILMGLIILGMALFAYFVVTSVQAESEATQSIVTGRLVLPEGVEIPEGMQVGILYPDYETPPQPYPAPFPTEPAPRSVESPDQLNRPSDWGPPEPSIPETEAYVYEPPVGTAFVDMETGEFSLPIYQYGIFVLSLIPPEGSYLTTRATVFVEANGSETILGDIQVVEAQLAGTLNQPGDVGGAEGYVVLMNESGSFYKTARSVNGRYFMTDIPAGTYSLRGYPSVYQDELFPAETIFVTIEDGAETIIQPIEFDGPDLFGTVTGPSGEPLTSAEIYVYSIDDGPYSDAYAYTNYDGEWRIGNLRDGEYRIKAYYYDYYYEDSFVPPLPIDVEVPNTDLPIDLQFEEWPIGLKVVNGQLVDQSGVPATNGSIYATNTERNLYRSTSTDAEGRFQLDLVSGSWQIEVYHESYYEADWVYLNSPVAVEFALDDSEEVENLQIVVNRYDAVVAGEIVSSNPEIPVPGYQVYLYSEAYGIDTGQYFPAGTPFAVNAPEGDYLMYIYLDTEEFAPIPPRQVSLVSGQTTDLGAITAIAPSATVKGNVSSSTGDPVAGVNVSAYPNNGQDFTRYEITDENGNYEIKVLPGEVSVSIYPYLEDYFYDGQEQMVALGENETVENVNFTVLERNSTIAISLTDSEGERLNNLSAWVSVLGVDNNFGDGGSFENGEVVIKTIPGEFEIYLDLYAEGYVFPRKMTVTVADGGTAQAQFKALDLDKKVVGRLYDIRSEETVVGLTGWVYGRSEEYVGGVDTRVSTTTGEYELDITDGNWYIDWYFASTPASGYTVLPSAFGTIEISGAPTTTLDIPLVRSDASISGQVTDSDGFPITDGYITLEGKDELAGFYRSADISQTGQFYIQLPHGDYTLRVGRYGYGYEEFPPEPVDLTIEPDENKAGLTFEFRKADTPLTVSFFAPGLTSGGELYVGLSSPYGGNVDITSYISSDGENGFGTIMEELVEGTWYLYASLYDGESEWAVSGPVIVDGPTEIQLEMHRSIYVYPSDYTDIEEDQNHQLTLENGASIKLPAGFLPSDSNVLGVSLVAGTYLPLNGLMEPVGMTYSFYGYTDSFSNSNSIDFSKPVSITLPYDESIESFMNPSDLRVMYHAVRNLGTLDSPTIIEDVVVDEVNRTVSFELSQFGYIGIVAPAELMPVNPTFGDVFQHQLVMPIIAR